LSSTGAGSFPVGASVSSVGGGSAGKGSAGKGSAGKGSWVAEGGAGAGSTFVSVAHAIESAPPTTIVAIPTTYNIDERAT
jgi:hypothetical protein